MRTERGNPQRLQRNLVALVSTLQLCDQQLAAPEHERQIVDWARSAGTSCVPQSGHAVAQRRLVNAGSQIEPTRLGLNGGDAYLLCHGGLQLGGANIANYAAVNRCVGLAAGARSLTGRAVRGAGAVVTRGAVLAEHAIELPLAGEAAGCGD